MVGPYCEEQDQDPTADERIKSLLDLRIISRITKPPALRQEDQQEDFTGMSQTAARESDEPAVESSVQA